MFSRQWEDFQDIITSYVPTVDDHGPLAGPIRRFKIWRDGDLQLCMDTEGPESVGGPETHYPPGTVRINEDRVTFRSDMGLELEAIGVSAAHTNTHIEGSAPGITTQKVDIHRLVGKFAPPQKPRYASVIRLNPAIRDRVKSGQRARPKT